MDATSQRSRLVEMNGILSTTKFTFNCPPVTFSSIELYQYKRQNDTSSNNNNIGIKVISYVITKRDICSDLEIVAFFWCSWND